MPVNKTSKLTFYFPDFESELRIPFINEGVSAGFPSPAADFMEMSIDLNKQLSENPMATFYIKVKGNSMPNSRKLKLSSRSFGLSEKTTTRKSWSESTPLEVYLKIWPSR